MTLMLLAANALKNVQLSPSSSTKRAESKNGMKHGLYLDLAAEHGKDIFLNATEDSSEKYSTPEGSPGKPAPKLHSTPSMAMLSEATLALKESPSALTKMTDIASTGGVYQLRRRTRHVWEENSTDSSPASTQSASFFGEDPKGARPTRPHACLQRSGLGLTMTTDPHKVLPKCAEKENHAAIPRRMQVSREAVERGRSAPARHRIRREPSKVAVFKPEDEETGANQVEWKVGAPNPEREGMVVGGGARRERAAYVLDKIYGGFSGVPPTALIKMPSHGEAGKGEQGNGEVRYKRGSLQKYCPSDGSAEDNPKLIQMASAEEVQKIAVLDLRIFNTDRHAGNILVQVVKEKGKEKGGKETVNLVPIDHALSLPDWRFLGEAYFDWAFWEQAHEPFSAASLQLIEKLDPDKDAEALREIEMPEACIATNRICTLTLKSAAKHRLSPRELSQVFERPYPPGHPKHNAFLSPLEMIIAEACQRAGKPYKATKSAGGGREESNDLERTQSSMHLPGSLDAGKSTLLSEDGAPSGEMMEHFVMVLEEKFASRKWEEWLV